MLRSTEIVKSGDLCEGKHSVQSQGQGEIHEPTQEPVWSRNEEPEQEQVSGLKVIAMKGP